MPTSYHEKEWYENLLIAGAGGEAARDPVIKEKGVHSRVS